MAIPRRNVLRLAAGAAGIALTSRLARAQTFPTRPITIVVPFPAGGPTDTLGRILADRMKTALGQAVIIENLTGAAGTIGSNMWHAHRLTVTHSCSAIGRRMSSMVQPSHCNSMS